MTAEGCGDDRTWPTGSRHARSTTAARVICGSGPSPVDRDRARHGVRLSAVPLQIERDARWCVRDKETERHENSHDAARHKATAQALLTRLDDSSWQLRPAVAAECSPTSWATPRTSARRSSTRPCTIGCLADGARSAASLRVGTDASYPPHVVVRAGRPHHHRRWSPISAHAIGQGARRTCRVRQPATSRRCLPT